MEIESTENGAGDRVKISVEVPTYTIEQREQTLREFLMKKPSEVHYKDNLEKRYDNLVLVMQKARLTVF